jgi:hypothetical protein
VIIPDETLMAYADGELDAAARAALDTALIADPELAQRVAQHVALRQRVRLAYSAELSDPVPERLLAAARRSDDANANVVSFKDARDAKSRAAPAARSTKTWWRPLGAIAASVIIGFALGYGRQRNSAPFNRSGSGSIVAGGQLANALSRQLASDQGSQAAVHIGLSFLAKNGEYCRTFILAGSVTPAGLACHHGQEWRIDAMSQETDSASSSGYRTAGSALAPSILKVVEERISGDPLDPAGETAALRKDWK